MSNAARITALRKALEWYADHDNYDEDHAPVVRGFLSSVFDEGARAKHALNADNEAADADSERIRRIATVEVANLAARAHEPISTDCQAAEDEIERLGAINAEMLVTLETLMPLLIGIDQRCTGDTAMLATVKGVIARAKGV